MIDGGPNCQELARSLRQLLDAALEVGDREVECRIRVALGALCADSLGDLREGRDHQRIALSLNAGSITGTRLTAFAAALLAASTRMGVESAASLAHAERAIRLARRVDDRAIECQCLVHMAKTLSDAGRFAEAEERARQARMLARQLGNPGLEATALQEVGASRGFQGDHQAAIELCDQAVRLARRAGLILREGWALARLGQMYMLAGQLERGEESADAALRVLTRATGPLHRARVLVLHGILLQALGRTEQSYCVLRSAAEAFAPMHDVHLTHERVDAELEAPIVFVLREHLDEVIAERARRREGIVSESTVG